MVLINLKYNKLKRARSIITHTNIARPLSFYINTHDTGKVDSETLIKKINSIVDLTPSGIRDHLNLHKPIYKASAAYGHFGREPGDDGSFSWEKTDLVDQLKNL